MPTTAHGKAVAARNATSHGLFARDIVLPSLGEDPDGYRQVQEQLSAQIQPRTLLERHYVEKIAAASWRLRRLHRWQAQLFEDPTLTEDQRLNKLDAVLRHENHLHRHIDTAVKMLAKDVPQLDEGRARRQALANTIRFEAECRRDLEADLEVTVEARRLMQSLTAAPPLDHERLDTAPAPSLSSLSDSPRIGGRGASPLPLAGEGLGAEPGEVENCQNELSETDAQTGEQDWKQAGEQWWQEHQRLLQTYDVSHVHDDGRPVYVEAESWEWYQELRREGDDAQADTHQARDRHSFLEDQQELAEEAGNAVFQASGSPRIGG